MLSLILVAALSGQIRSCQTATSYRQTYAATTYAAPVQYQAQAYATYAAPAYVETRYVAVEDPYYASVVGQRVRAELKAKEELRDTADLTAQVRELAAQVGQLSTRIGGGAVSPPPVQPPPVSPLPPPPSPPSSGPDPAVLGILTNRCSKCHTGEAKAGKGFALFSEPGKLSPLGPLDLALIDTQVYSGDMPKGAKPLEAQEYSLLRAWINESRDEIEAALRACREKGAK